MAKGLMRLFVCFRFVILLLLVMVSGVFSCRADELDDFIAAQKQRCEQRSRELEMRKQQLQTAIQSQRQPGREIQEHLRATEKALDQVKTLLMSPPQQKEDYARSLSVAVAQIGIARRAIDHDLHVDPASVIDRLVDQNALSTFGKGSPTTIVGFDGSSQRTHSWEVLTVGGSQPFQPAATPVKVSQYSPITVKEAIQVQQKYGSIPQGVALEGYATGLGEIHSAHYDAAFNAIVLDDRAAYFVKIAPWALVTLCRAIGADDQERIGVSYGRVFQPYGRMPLHTALGQDLIVTDKFLADIVFAADDWTAGYKFKDGFRLHKRESDGRKISVSFKFYGFEFKLENEKVIPTAAAFDIKLYPIADKPAPDGGAQPDTDAIANGRTFPEYETNARHLADNIAYYRRERVVDHAFLYGETAALLRALKVAQIDLGELASEIL
jgi:hypothetical protein